jgi:hypothetical protein
MPNNPNLEKGSSFHYFAYVTLTAFVSHRVFISPNSTVDQESLPDTAAGKGWLTYDFAGNAEPVLSEAEGLIPA